MRVLKTFEEFIKMREVIKRTPDLARADSLTQEAKKRKKFLAEMQDKIKLSDENANYFIEHAYDILMGLIRARILRAGYHATAHDAEISYMRNLKFSEKDVKFMNDLRYFRNGILYYGKEFDQTYGEKVLSYLDAIFSRLQSKP